MDSTLRILLVWALVAGWIRLRPSGRAARPPRARQVPRDQAAISTKRNRVREILWPRITDIESAKGAAGLGAGAAFWVAGLPAALAVLGIVKVITLLDSSVLVEAIAFAIIGFLVMKKLSRGAAITGLLLNVIGRVYIIAAAGSVSGLDVVALVPTLFLITGVRGTHAYHRYDADSEDDTTVAKAA